MTILALSPVPSTRAQSSVWKAIWSLGKWIIFDLDGPHLLGAAELVLRAVAGAVAIAFVLAMVLSGILWVFLHTTDLGKAMRAAAQNRYVAVLMGINPNRVFCVALGIALALAVGAALKRQVQGLVRPPQLLLEGQRLAVVDAPLMAVAVPVRDPADGAERRALLVQDLVRVAPEPRLAWPGR